MAGQNSEDLKGKVLQGTCGWSDSSIVKCGRFYPASVKTTEDRLLHYSRFFPCVECDSSNYAIPSPAAVEKWIKCVPAGFKFHFKAFGFFTRKTLPTSALPHVVRDELPETLRQQTSVMWEELTKTQQCNLWIKYNSALLPAYQKRKLGVVIFQFHTGFHPSDDNKSHVLECRYYLDARFPMAVEFRSRVWFSEENLSATLDWLSQHNIGLVVADDLENELYGNPVTREKDRASSESALSRGRVVPIVMALGSCDFAYIRIHRRTGKHRLLSEGEIKSWGERLRAVELQSKIRGPIYFMWGTDHEDQPVINAKNLTKEIGDLAYDWKSKISNTGMLRFCSKGLQGNFTTEKRRNGLENEKSSEEDGTTFVIKDTLETKTNLVQRTDSPDEGQQDNCGESRARRIAAGELTAVTISSSNKKRALSSRSDSPNKKRLSAGELGKNATPTKQRIISDFFKR